MNIKAKLPQNSMEELNQSAPDLIQKLLKLHPTKEKSPREKLLDQLWKMINSLETTEEKLSFLMNLAPSLSKENIRQKLLRRQLVSCLMEIINESGRMWQTSVEYSGESWLQTLEYVYQNLENYDPNRASVITWVNNYYRWRCYDVKIEENTRDPQIMNLPPQYQDQDENPDPLELIADKNPDNSQRTLRLLKQIRTWVKTDEELNLISVKKELPEVTAAKIILRRLPPEEAEWRELAEEFEVKITDKKTGELKLDVSSLSSFYERQCRTRLIEYILSLGYERPDTPMDPVQDLKLIIKQVGKIYKNENFADQLQLWVNNSQGELGQIVCKNQPDLTADLFFNQFLNFYANKPKLQTKFLAEKLNIKVPELEKFYEFRCQGALHNFLENQGYNVSRIYQ
jgi:hypothetical protein